VPRWGPPLGPQHWLHRTAPTRASTSTAERGVARGGGGPADRAVACETRGGRLSAIWRYFHRPQFRSAHPSACAPAACFFAVIARAWAGSALRLDDCRESPLPGQTRSFGAPIPGACSPLRAHGRRDVSPSSPRDSHRACCHGRTRAPRKPVIRPKPHAIHTFLGHTTLEDGHNDWLICSDRCWLPRCRPTRPLPARSGRGRQPDAMLVGTIVIGTAPRPLHRREPDGSCAPLSPPASYPMCRHPRASCSPPWIAGHTHPGEPAASPAKPPDGSRRRNAGLPDTFPTPAAVGQAIRRLVERFLQLSRPAATPPTGAAAHHSLQRTPLSAPYPAS